MNADSRRYAAPDGFKWRVLVAVDKMTRVIIRTLDALIKVTTNRHRNWDEISERDQRSLMRLGDDLTSDLLREIAAYRALPAERRREVVHPRNLAMWLTERRPAALWFPDHREDGEDAPPWPVIVDGEPEVDEWALPASDVPDEGPQPHRAPNRRLLIAASVGAAPERVAEAVKALLTEVHPHVLRTGAEPGAGPPRERRTEDDARQAIHWYYRRAAGTPLKELAVGENGRRVERLPTSDPTRDRVVRERVGSPNRRMIAPNDV